MAKSKYIYPVSILNDNQCPKCGSKMILIEETTCINSLNSMGFPDPSTNLEEKLELKLQCTNCNNDYDVEKKGPYFRVKRNLKPIIYDKNIINTFNPFLINE